MSFGEFRDSNLRAMFEAVSVKNLQLQQAIRSGNDQLVRVLDREIDPLISALISYRAVDLDDIYLQMRLLTKFLREDADDRSCVLRHASMLSLLVERYFGPKRMHETPMPQISEHHQRYGGDDEQLNEAILNNLPERVAVVTCDYRYLFANTAMAGMLGKRQIELIGRSVFDLGLASGNEEGLRHALDAAFAGRSGSFVTRMSVSMEVCSVPGRFSPLRAADGSISGAILTLGEPETVFGGVAA
ncbi:PAS domain-containing protein [Rhizobium rhizophilum]|uniref:PAS domain-containing protein n=1 Tax=Rhizobium rhizophilum TaxID=1850373 RepID=A0ABY2QP60_9HYPH|nr:PAS domain-containing protein [Rhizobium rhizophilum]THV11036.1 PAS domain-containing protein [Rhizobium rhizophilum]